jgi:hypothetical protein
MGAASQTLKIPSWQQFWQQPTNFAKRDKAATEKNGRQAAKLARRHHA